MYQYQNGFLTNSRTVHIAPMQHFLFCSLLNFRKRGQKNAKRKYRST
nr:MAG TPA: hypothetical protein [Caudoviricetes sp.]